MSNICPPADTRSATLRLKVIWRAALKSEPFALRWKLIYALACRPPWQRYQQSMRLKKAALFRNFGARTEVQTRADAGVTATVGEQS
jgi:hypothetical protein